MRIQKQKNNEIKAIVFDLDATLMDTEDFWYLADKKLLSEFGIDFTKEMKEKYIGISLDDMVSDLYKLYSLRIPVEEVKQKKNRYFLEVSRGKVGLFPEMKILYEQLKLLSLPMTIATGTDSDVVRQVLTDNGILNDFTFVLTAAEVGRGKPFPDIYLETAQRLRQKPENILVFEDSPYGVESALSAGMVCVAIPYLMNKPLADVFSGAHVLIEEGIRGLEPQRLLDWITK